MGGGISTLSISTDSAVIYDSDELYMDDCLDGDFGSWCGSEIQDKQVEPPLLCSSLGKRRAEDL